MKKILFVLQTIGTSFMLFDFPEKSCRRSNSKTLEDGFEVDERMLNKDWQNVLRDIYNSSLMLKNNDTI